MRKALIFLILLVFFIPLALAAFITWDGLRDSSKKTDIIVVFGNEVYADGTLSARLQARMDKAIELFHRHPVPYLFVSGGIGKSNVEESGAMRRYAVSRGVPENRIIADPLGVNTKATAKNAAEFMRQHNLQSALLVSQFFHLARASLEFKNNDIWNLSHAHADYFELRDIYSLGREVVALVVAAFY